MKLVVFGLAISSSWGNGHATLWRGLCRALGARGHDVVFFERDVPYYAAHRDLWELPGGGTLFLYPSWDAARPRAARELADADVGLITSFCPDAHDAEPLLLDSRTPRKVFYDLDTPVTLDRLDRGEVVPYVGPHGLAPYDLVFSYTGGRSLRQLEERLGARQTAPLYGSVDPEVHRPATAVDLFRADLSYLGTYAADRQPAVERLFLAPAQRLPSRRFVLGGSQYPADFPWGANVFYMQHVAPDYHPAFYSSSRLTLNVTRRAMADTGYCPSGRLFEAAACGAAILSDAWDGLDAFFTPGEEILVAHDTDDAVRAVECDDRQLARVARAARERTLAEHTAAHRAAELEHWLEGDGRVGNHSGGRGRHTDPAACILEGAAAGRLPARRDC